MSFNYTTETILNDLSRVSVIDDSTTLAAPASPAAVAAAGGNLTAGTYYYKITALNAQGETVGSTEASATTASSNLSVSVSWTAVSGATSYRIYRGTSSGAQNKYFTDTASPFVDSVLADGTAGTVPATNTAYVNNDPGVPSGDKALFIKRLNKFLNSNTTIVYKNAGYNGVNEVATITLPSGASAAGTYRLRLDVIMSGSYPADYDRYAINKGKPFYVEVTLPIAADESAFATALVAGIKKGLIKNNGAVIQDIVVTANAGTVVITAANEYQRFVGVYLEKLNTAGEDYDAFVTGAVTTPGKEGFGTAWALLKNYRIPTQEATRFMGEDQDERPVTGLIYNQYTIKYDALRNIGSSSYVGARGITHTDHVIFVPQTLASTFEANLVSAFGADKVVAAF